MISLESPLQGASHDMLCVTISQVGHRHLWTLPLRPLRGAWTPAFRSQTEQTATQMIPLESPFEGVSHGMLRVTIAQVGHRHLWTLPLWPLKGAWTPAFRSQTEQTATQQVFLESPFEGLSHGMLLPTIGQVSHRHLWTLPLRPLRGA
jgi:hypothetical protein